MPNLDMVWLFIYPTALFSIVVVRLYQAFKSNVDLQVNRKSAQASYWGEYCDCENKRDDRCMILPEVTKEPTLPAGPSDKSTLVWH